MANVYAQPVRKSEIHNYEIETKAMLHFRNNIPKSNLKIVEADVKWEVMINIWPH